MSARTLLTMVLLAATGLSNMACQNKDHRSDSASSSPSENAQGSDKSVHDPRTCPAHIGGAWKIGTTSQTLKFDTSNGQIKIQVPMGDYSLVDGAPHVLRGGRYLGYCANGRLVFNLTQIAANGTAMAKTKWIITTAGQNNGQAEVSFTQRDTDTGKMLAPKTERFDLNRQ